MEFRRGESETRVVSDHVELEIEESHVKRRAAGRIPLLGSRRFRRFDSARAEHFYLQKRKSPFDSFSFVTHI